MVDNIEIAGIGTNYEPAFRDFRVLEKIEIKYRKDRIPVYKTFKDIHDEPDACCPECDSILEMLIELEPNCEGKNIVKKAVLYCGLCGNDYAYDILKDRELRSNNGRFSFP